MSLSLALGMPVDMMLRSMTEAELVRWHTFAARNQLPTRRIELMLAQVCALIARTMGGVKTAKVADFLPQPMVETTDLEAAKRAFKFNPRPKLKVVDNGSGPA